MDTTFLYCRILSLRDNRHDVNIIYHAQNVCQIQLSVVTLLSSAPFSEGGRTVSRETDDVSRKTAKQFPVRPVGDDILISWAKDIVECSRCNERAVRKRERIVRSRWRQC